MGQLTLPEIGDELNITDQQRLHGSIAAATGDATRQKEGKLKVGGFTLDAVYHNRTGGKSALWVDDEGVAVLSFDSLNPPSLVDLSTDAQAAAGIRADQYRLAEEFAFELGAKYENNSFIGRSLGGSLAVFAAVVTGGTATVFNAFGLSDRLTVNYDISQAKITHFESSGDRITKTLHSALGLQLPGSTTTVNGGGWHPVKTLCEVLQFPGF